MQPPPRCPRLIPLPRSHSAGQLASSSTGVRGDENVDPGHFEKRHLGFVRTRANDIEAAIRGL